MLNLTDMKKRRTFDREFKQIAFTDLLILMYVLRPFGYPIPIFTGEIWDGMVFIVYVVEYSTRIQVRIYIFSLYACI